MIKSAYSRVFPKSMNISVVVMTLSIVFGLLASTGSSFSQVKQKRKLKQKRINPERNAPETVRPTIFMDAHVHLNDITMQLQLMEDHAITQAVVFWGKNSTNESLLKAVREHPDKFIPFVSLSPERKKYHDLWKRNDPELLRILENYLKTGLFKGIGEISVTHFPGRGFPEADFSPKSTLMKGIMKLAEKYKVPITIHCEITRIREFSNLLAEFKNVKVIWAHGGYTPYYLARRMLEKHSNLYYELSARTWLNHPRSSDYTIFKSNTEIWKQWLDLIEAKSNRFIVGSDSSNNSLERDKTKIVSVQSLLGQLSPGIRGRVAHENLRALIGLKE